MNDLIKEPACCGFGHRNYFPGKYEDDLSQILKRLYIENGVRTFYTGRMGNFDAAFSSSVSLLKRDHNDVKLYLVLPYFSNKLNNKTEMEYLKMIYDEIFIPDILSGVHYRAAITLRNRWMVDNSDYVVSGAVYDHGGAYQAIKYAENKGKNIIHTTFSNGIDKRGRI